jgi:transposase
LSGRLPLELHYAMFERVLAIAVKKKLMHGKTLAVDSTTLEANAAMKSIVRRDSGEDWKEYVTRLMREAGVIAAEETPSDDEIRRFDKGRKDKQVGNADWVSTTDEESRITRMKDGTTHLAYKAEHVVDVKSEFLLAVTLHGGDAADTGTLCDSLLAAQMHLQAAGSQTEVREVVADKGYHAAAMIEQCDAFHFRTYIPEPRRPHPARWTDKPSEYREAVIANRRRTRSRRGKRLSRLRSERVERSFAHVCETGGARRCWLTGLQKVTKRYVLQAAARNLGLLLRKLFGMGTPRGLQGSGDDVISLAMLTHFINRATSAATTAIGSALSAMKNALRRTRAPNALPALAT